MFDVFYLVLFIYTESVNTRNMEKPTKIWSDQINI